MTGGTVTNGGTKNILLLSTAAYLIKQLLLTNYCIYLNSSRTGYFFQAQTSVASYSRARVK